MSRNRNARVMPPCVLCERFVTAVSMWIDEFDGLPSAIYFHGDKERCFVANQGIAHIVSPISDLENPGETSLIKDA